MGADLHSTPAWAQGWPPASQECQGGECDSLPPNISKECIVDILTFMSEASHRGQDQRAPDQERTLLLTPSPDSAVNG